MIARNYQVILLASVLLCIAWSRRPRDFVLLGGLIALLCATHAFGIILATGFTAAIFLETFRTPEGRAFVAGHRRGFFIGMLIGALGAAVCTALIVPPSDNGSLPDWHVALQTGHVAQVATAYGNAYFPWPVNTVHFWNESLLPPWAAGVFGVAAVVLAVAAIRSSRPALIFFAISNGGMLLFLYAKLFGQWRHHGVLYVAFVVAAWIAIEHPTVASDGGGRRMRSRRIADGVLAGMLALQVYGRGDRGEVRVGDPVFSGGGGGELHCGTCAVG